MGSYTIKRIKNQDYLYERHYEHGRQIWKIIGNVKDVDPKHRGLIEAKSVIIGKKAKEIARQFLSGKIDKDKARNELNKLLDSM